MSLAINVEPYDKEMMEECSSPRNEKKSKKDKRGCGGCCGMSLLSNIVCIIVACALVIAVVLTAYFLIVRKPEPPYITTGTPPSTTMTPISPITVPPNETTSTAPCIPIRWLEDLPVSLPNNDLRRVSLFNGQASHSAMRIVCDKIDYDRSLTYEDHVRGRHIEYRGIVNFDKAEEEASFNEMIHSYDNTSTGTRTIFGNLPAANRLMWNGCYYTYNGNTKNWDNECAQNPLNAYNNFCDQLGWMKELKDLQSSAAKHKIFIVKDYRGDNKGCWQLYTELQILSITGSKGINARLPFACITANMSSISGEDALTQSKIPCHRQ